MLILSVIAPWEPPPYCGGRFWVSQLRRGGEEVKELYYILGAILSGAAPGSVTQGKLVLGEGPHKVQFNRLL